MAEPSPSRQQQRLKRAAGMVAMLLLGACQAVVPKAPPPAAPAPPPPPKVETGSLPTDEARNRVALLVPISGPNAAVGQSIANAANLAILDTGGARVRVTTYDTGAGAGAAAARALADGNRLFLGPLLADEVRAAVTVARPAGVPVIAFSNDASVAGNGTYLMGFSPTQSVDRVVRYARSRGITRFAGLMPTGAYGRTASNMLIKAAEAAGGSVVSMQTFDRSPQSLAAAVTRLGQDKAPSGQRYEAVLIADSGRIATQAALLLRRQGPVQILGTELWNAETTLSATPAMHGAWFASVPDAMYRQLGTKYRTRFGKGPYRLASLGYDAVLLTIRIAANWPVGSAFPARLLSDRDGFAGVDGAFRFRSDGVAERALAVQQIGPAGTTVIAPAPRGFTN